jgi:uncharacterized cupredoxin-like copper-binding protein
MIGLVTVASTAGLTLVGCGGSSKAAEVIKLSEYKMNLSSASIKAGTVVFEGENIGGTKHEVVLVAGDDPKALPTKADGEIDEEKIEESSKEGEVGEIEAGKALKHTYNLKPGKYIVFCNLTSKEAGVDVSHFAKGMSAVITVS